MGARRKGISRQRGTVLLLFALTVVLLLLFVGLAIDFGFAYVTRANLGKAVDAAALAGARNLYQGKSTAEAIAKSAFAMNYPVSNRDASPPVVTVTFPPDPNGNTLVNVSATATVNTLLIGLLPGYKSLDVANSAQATRAHVIMTLVLDKSGSMQNNGGWSALPSAVNNFIKNFDDVLDSVAVVTFASNVSVDVPMRTGGFKSPVQNLTAKMNYNYFDGATFSDGGLQAALVQNNSLVVPGNIVKIVVFFTDGHANTIQDILSCGGGVHIADGLWNYGGWDSPSNVSYMSPTGASQKAKCTENGNTCCNGKFPSHITGKMEPINWNKISSDNGEAQYRAVQTSDTMRSVANNMTVYSIGLGTDINKDFLYQVANDPHSATFDASKPQGEADFAPTAAELETIFQNLASKILLRLTQ